MSNGGMIGLRNVPTLSGANGIWTIEEAQRARNADLWPRMPFAAGNQSHGSVLEFLQSMADKTVVNMPTAGGTLTINSGALGSYDYVIKRGNFTIASGWSATDWFTTTQDSRSAIVVIDGNLTVNASQIFTPTVRKLFLAIYVTGTLTITGEVSMSQRGANHSASGSNITATAIRLATGTFSGVTNPQVPAAGAAGAARQTGGATNGNAGTAGSAGQTGGGGSGGSRSATGLGSGAGADGTSFSGGPGGGAGSSTQGGSANANGAAGGVGGVAGGNQAAGGGAGNPGGAGATGGGGATGHAGGAGTGGVLYLLCGTLAGGGAVTAAGAPGGGTSGSLAADAGGAGSGGGSVTIQARTDLSTIAPTALGGVGATSNFNVIKGGDGGNGTARKLAA